MALSTISSLRKFPIAISSQQHCQNQTAAFFALALPARTLIWFIFPRTALSAPFSVRNCPPALTFPLLWCDRMTVGSSSRVRPNLTLTDVFQPPCFALMQMPPWIIRLRVNELPFERPIESWAFNRIRNYWSSPIRESFEFTLTVVLMRVFVRL